MTIGVETALGTISLPSPFNPFDPFLIRISQLLEPARAAVAVSAGASHAKH
jgi:hypothetical protein